MDKKQLSERDICTKFITPALRQAGWDELSQLREEVSFTKGRIIVRGQMVKRGKAKRADYILYYKPNIPLAVIEAKDNHCSMGDGLQQALEYADTLQLPFVFASNGDGFVFHDAVRNRLVETTGSAEETSRRIETFVQTLPPAGFQAQLTKLVVKSNEWISKGLPRKLRDDVPASELIPVIRALLHGLASLALAYDGNPLVDGHSALYSANVMVFVPNADAASLSLNFFPPEHDREQLKGVLLLRQDLSATSESHEPDALVSGIALPVPTAAERDGRWVALLGGPRALLTGAVDGHVDTALFADECAKRGDFQPSVLAQLRTYFVDGPGRAVRSFVSRRLEYGGEVVGVVNLHANRRDLLGPRLEKRETFHALATPLVVDLAEAVAALVRSNGPLPPASDSGTIKGTP